MRPDSYSRPEGQLGRGLSWLLSERHDKCYKNYSDSVKMVRKI